MTIVIFWCKNVFSPLIIAKHVVYCVRFCENIEKRPTNRMLILTCIIELQKLVPCRLRMGTDVVGLNEVISELRREIHWSSFKINNS